jgi:hypothetical protein
MRDGRHFPRRAVRQSQSRTGAGSVDGRQPEQPAPRGQPPAKPENVATALAAVASARLAGGGSRRRRRRSFRSLRRQPTGAAEGRGSAEQARRQSTQQPRQQRRAPARHRPRPRRRGGAQGEESSSAEGRRGASGCWAMGWGWASGKSSPTLDHLTRYRPGMRPARPRGTVRPTVGPETLGLPADGPPRRTSDPHRQNTLPTESGCWRGCYHAMHGSG